MDNLDKYISEEAYRRVRMLGETISLKDYSYAALCDRAQIIRVPVKILVEWWRSYAAMGLDGLKPQWQSLPEKSLMVAKDRREKLGVEVDEDILTPDYYEKVSQAADWSWSKTNRLISRYRVGGLWGLTPENNPNAKKKKKQPSPRDIGSFDEKTLEEIYRRFAVIEPLLEQPECSQAAVEARAQEMSVSPRTVWNYLSYYRRYGLPGLAPNERSDKGRQHNISERMSEVVAGIRLSQPDLPAHAVHLRACERARVLGEIEPSINQVRSIIKSIPLPIKLIADRRHKQFKNSFRFTHRINFLEIGVVIQIDNNLVDVLVKDQRDKRYRTASGEIRPWLTQAMEASSNVILAAIFSYDQPDQYTIAAVIRQAILQDENKRIGGKPDQIWVDNGKDLVSNHVGMLTKDLDIYLKILPRHQPQQKGKEERMFKTLSTRLWSTLAGYVNSNTSERNPSAKAELTISQLAGEYWKFINQFHNEVHSDLGMTPLEYWDLNCFTEPVDPRRLDMLLMITARRRVLKTGVKYSGKQYWHPNLGPLVGEEIVLRVNPHYEAPDEIEVFHGALWCCTAYATDTDKYREVSRATIANAQREQKSQIKDRIESSRDKLKAVDNEIRTISGDKPEASESKKATHQKNVQAQKPSGKQKRKPDILDLPNQKGDE